MSEAKRFRVWGGIAGLFTSIILNGVFVFLIWCVMIGNPDPDGRLIKIAAVLVLGIGAVQFAYIIPVAIWARRSNHRSFAAGIIVGAAIIFLLNAACWGGILLDKRGRLRGRLWHGNSMPYQASAGVEGTWGRRMRGQSPGLTPANSQPRQGDQLRVCVENKVLKSSA
jgi:hypothetical protein